MKSPIAALAVLALLHTLATLVLAVAGPVDTHVPPSDIELKRFTAYSFAAYSNIELSRPFGCKPCQHPLVNGTELVYTWAKDIPSIHGYIGVNHALKTIVVAFRGTAGIHAILEDLVAVRLPFPSGVRGSDVHGGFLLAYNSVAEGVRGTVAALVRSYPSYELVFTGHSMGSAHAIIAAVDTLPLVPATTRVRYFGIGAPRVGSPAFAAHVNSLRIEAVRVNQFRDIAARIPPSLMGFQHIDREIWIKPGSGEIKYCKAFGGAQGGSGEDPDCINSVPFNQLTPNDHPVYFGIGSDFDF